MHDCSMGDTPLTLACEKGLEDVARLLIEKGAGVNAKTRKGYISLTLACSKVLEDV